MSTLYFLSLLDSIIGVAVLFVIIGVVAFGINFCCKGVNQSLDPESRYEANKIRGNTYLIKKTKPFIVAGLIALFILCITPTSKQGYMIYGVGSTIDYVKNNETAKKLPDKAIKALDKFLDEEAAIQTEEQKEEKVKDCDEE